MEAREPREKGAKSIFHIFLMWAGPRQGVAPMSSLISTNGAGNAVSPVVATIIIVLL